MHFCNTICHMQTLPSSPLCAHGFSCHRIREKPPTPTVETSSIHLRNNLASDGQYIAVLPRSVLKLSAQRYVLKELPIRLSAQRRPWQS